jgi:class 3 adenylate cyclase
LNNIADGTKTGLSLLQGEDQCQYLLRVYPSQVFYNEYVTNTPVKITCAVAFIFLFTTLLFLVYDRLVERRQRLLLSKAERSTAIVSSLFPRNVRDRLMQEHSEKGKNSGFLASNQRLKSFLNGDLKDNEEPIADLFPNCTVMFADIAGFTAWSSTRDPKQVFVLLQTVYQAFDEIAKRRRVFKVETIGDSYVAATGLPEPQESHALIMARFASDCMQKMNELMKVLEVSLGPDTADLSMRFGLHSGQVTGKIEESPTIHMMFHSCTMSGSHSIFYPA